LIYQNDSERCRNILSSVNCEINQTDIESFDKKEKLLELKFGNYFHRNTAAKLLEEAGIMSPDSDTKIPDAFLMSLGIRGPVEIRGKARQGRIVDLVSQDPELSAPDDYSPLRFPLKLCSIDIETDVKTGTILAIGHSVSIWNEPENKNSLVRVLLPVPAASHSGGTPAEAAAALAVPDTEPRTLIFHHDEKDMLQAFLKDMAEIDADILTGWNFLDFDYPRLAERCEFHHIPFLLGRSQEEAKYFPGAGGGAEETAGNDLGRRYSAAALVPGRQVIDALRIMRSGPRKLPGYTLEAAAQSVLGVSKTVTSSGDEKIRELESLYREDPVQFGEYCKTDAELVLQILDKTGLFRLTLERACLTGVSLDKAWTSVVSFERVYGMELYKRKIAAPAENSERDVSGAAGGTVLEPMPGIFHNVGVFDFRSLYPTIMRTFNIDPLAHARIPAETLEARTDQATEPIKAPNGALFSREAGILPRLIASYFEERRKAIAKGDNEASHVYKILMNSFYGVLGTSSCRYGRTELAGAITSFARKWLLFSRDWFNEKGCRVLYGDTDSLFAESGLGDKAPYAAFVEWGNSLTKELNLCLSQAIRKEYGLESCIELRFEKPYRRFMIPPLRNLKTESRGRAKGYGGWLLDSSGQLSTEVKGMEAVRSDSTALARRIQVEILEQVFRGGGPDELKAYISGILKELRQGLLDKELVYRKRLARPPETYTSSTPPQVKAARALGWKNRRGTVEYVWTASGAEPAVLPHAPLDYDHYAESQVLPVAGSIAAAAGWDTEMFSINKKAFLNTGQIELGF
jgi:DNA polymerase-2